MRKLKLGVVGLGRAFALTAPTLARDKRIELLGGFDPRAEALEKVHEILARRFASFQDS
jgi:phthalate 4,5-cis-dihydrodiol dehydrogenase